MRFKFLFAVCISFLAVSCGPKTGCTPPDTPPVPENRLTSVTISAEGSAPTAVFGASYKDGRMETIQMTEWFLEEMKVSEGRLGNIAGFNSISDIITLLSKSSESEWSYDMVVKYEKDAVVLFSEEYEESLILKLDDKGRVVSVVYDDSEEKLDAMSFSYNAAGQLAEYNTYGYYSSTDQPDWIKTTTLSFEYSNGSLSSMTVTVKEDVKVVDKYEFSFGDTTVKNAQGIINPMCDPEGFLTAFGALGVTGVKSVNLPKTASIKMLLIDGEQVPDIPGLAVGLGFDYTSSSDGFIEKIKCNIKIDVPLEESEEMAFEFGYKFEK